MFKNEIEKGEYLSDSISLLLKYAEKLNNFESDWDLYFTLSNITTIAKDIQTKINRE